MKVWGRDQMLFADCRLPLPLVPDLIGPAGRIFECAAAAESEESEDVSGVGPLSRTGGPVSILIVEDEGLVALSISQILSTAGYEIIGIAGSADAAIRTAEDHRPDLVLMDIALRGRRDGIEAAHALKNQHDLQVLFVTAHGDAETRSRAEAVRPAGFLIKPYDGKELLSAVEQALATGA